MPVSAPMSLFYQHDKYMENPEACTLVDISTGGACIESEYIHAEGEVLRMKAQIEDYAPMTFLGEIIRVEETSPGVFRYGFLFAKLKEEEITSLNRTLYNLQVGNREEWSRRTPNGNWS
jgi:c-di-GMP-binding flagellar brake protein YcgR